MGDDGDELGAAAAPLRSAETPPEAKFAVSLVDDKSREAALSRGLPLIDSDLEGSHGKGGRADCDVRVSGTTKRGNGRKHGGRKRGREDGEGKGKRDTRCKE